MNDGSLKNITSWVSKKVPELVGMEEPDLVEFIMANVRKQASAGESAVPIMVFRLPCSVSACLVLYSVTWCKPFLRLDADGTRSYFYE